MFFFTICLYPLKHFWYFTEWVNDRVESVDISKNSNSNHPNSSLLKTWVIYFLRSNYSVLCFCEPLRRLLWCISFFRWMLKQLSRLITKADHRRWKVVFENLQQFWHYCVFLVTSYPSLFIRLTPDLSLPSKRQFLSILHVLIANHRKLHRIQWKSLVEKEHG